MLGIIARTWPHQARALPPQPPSPLRHCLCFGPHESTMGFVKCLHFWSLPNGSPYHIHDLYKPLRVSRHCVPSLGRGKIRAYITLHLHYTWFFVFFLNLIGFFYFLYFSFSFILVWFFTLTQDFMEPSLFDLELLVPSAGIIIVCHHTRLVLLLKLWPQALLPVEDLPTLCHSPPLWRVHATHSFWKRYHMKTVEPLRNHMPLLSRRL